MTTVYQISVSVICSHRGGTPSSKNYRDGNLINSCHSQCVEEGIFSQLMLCGYSHKPAGRLDNKKELLDGNLDKLDRTA